MALSNGRGTSNTPLVYLSARSTYKDAEGKSQDLDIPVFEVSRIDPTDSKIKKSFIDGPLDKDGNPTKLPETCRAVSGDLTGIQFKTREFNGKSSDHTILFIRDAGANETYYIDFTSRLSTRSLFNALLNLENPKGITISIYRSKKGFESFGVEQDGKNIKWKHSLDALPKAEKITNKKGEVVQTDFSEVDAFMQGELKAFAAKFGFGKTESVPAADASKTTTAKPVQEAAGEEDPEGTVPF